MLIPEKIVTLREQAEECEARSANDSQFSQALPDEPVTRIRPPRRWRTLELKELWERRELFYFLVWRDLKTRYKQTALGASWVVLQPLLMTAIFTVFLGRLVRVPADGVPYAVFAYAGLLPWAFFSNAILSSSHSLVASAPLLTKIYFPRLFLPLASVIVRLADFCVASLILFAMLFYYGFKPSPGMLLFLPLLLELTLLALGCGLWSAALNVRYRDVGTLLPVLLQLWMFTSPIIYSSSVVPEKWLMLYRFNPLAGIIEGMRASLFGFKIDWGSIGISAIMTTLLLLYSIYSFQKAEESFADIV
jgi:homopolymeric O-antigen transport system permease protein